MYDSLACPSPFIKRMAEVQNWGKSALAMKCNIDSKILFMTLSFLHWQFYRNKILDKTSIFASGQLICEISMH